MTIVVVMLVCGVFLFVLISEGADGSNMDDRAKIAWDKLNVKERKLFSIVILVTILLSVILALSYGNGVEDVVVAIVMTISATFVSVLIYVNFIRSRKSLKNEAYNSDAKFTCPYCSQRVEVPNSLFGQMISCPTCEKDFRASGIAERDGRTVTVRKNS